MSRKLLTAALFALGCSAVLGTAAAADEAPAPRPVEGQKVDPELLKKLQEKFGDVDPDKLKELLKNADPEKLKQLQGRLGGTFDPEKLKERLKNADPEKLKERLKNLDPEKLKKLEERFGGKIDPEKLKKLLEKRKKGDE